MGTELLPWVIGLLTSAAPPIAAVSGSINIVKALHSLETSLEQTPEENRTDIENRLIKLTPLVAMVQSKIVIKLKIALIMLVTVFSILLLANYLGWLPTGNLLVYPVIVALVINSLGISLVERVKWLKSLVIGPLESRILAEHQACYQAYLHEKLDELEALNETQMKIFKRAKEIIRCQDIKPTSEKELRDLLEMARDTFKSECENDYGLEQNLEKINITSLTKLLLALGYADYERRAWLRKEYYLKG